MLNLRQIQFNRRWHNKPLNTARADARARTSVTPRLLWVALRALIAQFAAPLAGRLVGRYVIEMSSVFILMMRRQNPLKYVQL